jgi:hypothetical protein
MPSQVVLISLEVIDEAMRKLTTLFNGLIPASYGTTLGSEVILWFVSTCSAINVSSSKTLSSHLLIHFLVLTSTNSWRPTCCISLSKECSKITLWNGLEIISF